MKLALLFLGMAVLYLFIGWLVSFPIKLRTYSLQFQALIFGADRGGIGSAQYDLWTESAASAS